jgi:hypothetical protein
MKMKSFKNGYVTFEKLDSLYRVVLNLRSGKTDTVHCDTYKSACDYFKSFALIAKNA